MDIALNISCAALCATIAYFKGRRILLWTLLGYAGTLFTIAILVLRKTLPRKYYPSLAAIALWLVDRTAAKEMKTIETAEDFLREANKKPRHL